LSLAARNLCLDQGPLGATGHYGSDGSSPNSRVTRYGQVSGTIGENLSYGVKTALEVVFKLLIDDGVPNRGHRNNMLN
jgi:uncharacterized protein YkwD